MYDPNWKSSGSALESSVDVIRKLEAKKVLSGVEKSGLLSKAEALGVTLSSVERLGLLSKAEELGLLSLLDSAAAFSLSVSLPLFLAALAAAQAVLAAALGVGGTGLLVASVVLARLQEPD